MTGAPTPTKQWGKLLFPKGQARTKQAPPSSRATVEEGECRGGGLSGEVEPGARMFLQGCGSRSRGRLMEPPLPGAVYPRAEEAGDK